MVDSPFWIGKFSDAQFAMRGTVISVVVDAPPNVLDMQKLIRRDETIIQTEADWIGLLPIRSYMLLYQFSDGGEVEGMEHSRATAIEVPASAIRADISAIDSVTAHEFFHLWNIRRIRPCSMVPVEYTKEPYTSDLWFSEGATSAVARLILLRAGLLTEQQYLDRLGSLITGLENTPARKYQSVEDASRTVWLSRYPAYQAPDRSISHYQKGELLTVMLDLLIRKETEGHKSLQDVFRYLESAYGTEGR